MKTILIYFAPLFREFGADIALRLRDRHPGLKVHGLVAGPPSEAAKLRERLGDAAGQLISWQQEAEGSWVKTPPSREAFAGFEERYPPGTFGETVTADRRIGRGFVSCGFPKPNAIGELTVGAPNDIPANYVIGLYGFLERLFEDIEIDAVFTYVVANAPALALSKVAEARGIPFQQIATVRIADRVTIDTSHRGDLRPIAARFERFRQNPELAAPWREQAKGYLTEFRSKPLSPGYQLRHETRLARQRLWKAFGKFVSVGVVQSGRYLIDRIQSRKTKVARAYYAFQIQWRSSVVERRYLRTYEPDGTPYIYYPLHVDPEASTMVLAPHATDQMAVLEALAKSLPAGWRIVVKENISGIGKRPYGFYERLSQMPGVCLASTSQSTFELLRGAALTVTITGTVGWEAFLLGRPVLVLGVAHYSAVGSGVVVGKNLSTLPDLVRAALREPPASDEELVLYLCAIFSLSVEMNSELLWGGRYLRCDADIRDRAAEGIARLILDVRDDAAAKADAA
ncbi:MAG: hypothetical protein ACE368_06465 [Paracoccaceae bacterium]